MADLDFITDLTSGFKVSLTSNPRKVAGNRVLLNRFEITFLTKAKMYLLGDGTYKQDNYGGNGDMLISSPQVINDPTGIVANISMCIERTVTSIKQDEPAGIPDTEKLSSARLLNIYIQNDIIMASVQVVPVQNEEYEDLITNLPVIKR